MGQITSYNTDTSPAAGDVLPIVDISDLTQSPQGTTKKVTVAGLGTAIGGAPLAGATFTGWLAPSVVALTFGSSIAVNAALGNIFRVTLTSSAGTLANPTFSAGSQPDGQEIKIRVTQDGTGSRTLAYGTAYDFGAAGAPTLSTAAGKVDVLKFEWNAALSKWCFSGASLGF